MNEQYIQDLYNGLGGQAKFGAYDDFKDLIQNDQSYRSDFYNAFGEGTLGAFSDFESLVKKKEEEGLPVQNQSQQPVATELPSVDSSSELPSPTGDRNKDILALGKGPLAQMPTAAEPSIEEKVKEATKPQIKNLVISTKVMDLVGSGVKEKDAISSIAKEYELPEEDVKVTVDQLKPYQEEAYFSPDTDFGAALQMMRSGPMSNPVLSTVAEFIDDMGRSIGQGAKQAEGVRPSTDLMIDLGASDAETIKKFVQAGNELNKMAPSDEMVSFQNIVDMEGGGVWGLIKGLAKNPTVGPQVMASSLANMANSVSLAAAGSTIAAGAAAGAGGGIYGSVAGAAASLPYAMAAASSTLEAAMTFQELVGEELKKRGLEFDEEGVKKLLEDDEAMKVIRARSLARGATIGAIDAITGKVATRIAAKPRMSSLSRAAQVAKTAATESIGGSAGEAAGRLVAGQPMDVVEIGLEGLAEAPMSAVDIVSATFNKPVVTINGQKANETELNNILDKIESGAITVDEFKKMNITVNNDVTGYAKRINDIIQTDDIKKSVVQASPDIDEESLNKIVVLEKELLKLEGNKTQSAKDRRSQISNEIKTIQENAIQKPTTEEGVLRPEGPTVELPKVGEGDQGQVAAEAGVPSAEAVRQVTDAELSGLMAYGGTMDMVNKIISQGISGKRSPQQVSEDVSNYLKGTNTYKTAPTDLMRESLLAKANELVLDQVKEQPKLTREEMMAESMGSPEIRAQVDESFKKTEGSKVTLENGEEATIKVEPLENNDIALVPEYTVSLIGKNGETVSSTVYNLDPKTGKIQRGAVSGAENFKFIEQTLSEGGMKKEGGAFVFEAKPAPEVAVEAEVELTPAKTEGEFEIVSGGKKLGQIKTEAVNDTDVKVSMVEVYEQKKGTATKAYAKLAEMLAAQGKKLVSDEARSEESEALWSSLERKGLAKKVGDTTTGMTFDYIYEYVVPTKEKAVEVSKEEQLPLSESTLPGYDATMEKVGGIIAKVIDRVRNEPDRDAAMRRAFDDVLGYLQGSDLYTKATDTQREQLVRDVRNRFYMKEKPAPSVGRILGTIKNVKKVTLSEKDALKNQLRAEARGAKNAAAAIKSATQSLAKELNDMVGAGKITAKQLTSIMNRFSKVKVLDETSVSNFVDYMANVFEDAEYMDKISKIKNILPTAKKNMMTKLGMGENLVPNLQKIFNINPTFIPAEVFNKYMGLVEMIGKRQAVLELSEISDVIKTSDEIMSAIDQKLSLIDELADRFNSSENKVFNEDGTIDYAKTIEKMVEAGEASVEELELMRANKSKIYSTSKGPNEGYIYNRVNELLDEGESISGAIGQVAEELGIETSVVGEAVDNKTKEKADLIETVKSMADDMATDRFDTEDERNDARRLKKLLTTDAVNSMSISDLNNIVKMIDNINNGYISNFSKIMSEKLESVIAGKDVAVSVEKAKPMPISKIIGKAKTLLTGSQNFYDEIIKRGVLYYIDQSLGDFKTKRVFNAIFERASEAMSRYEYELNRISDVLDTAQERVAKSHGMDHNKTLKAKYKMMAYMLQLEYDSNKGAKVNPAMDVLKETAKFIESNTTKYNDNDLKIIKDIMKNYRDEKGQIDSKKLYDSFNQSEKDAIRTMQEVNKSLRGKAVYTSSVIRGDRIRPLDNYIHHSVMYKDNEASRMKDVTSPSRIGESMKPSTKAKSLISRTGAVMPLNLDPFAAVHKGSKAVLMDYYLTSPIRTARRAFNQARVQMKRDGAYTSDSRKIIDAIENAFETTLEDTLTKSFNQSSLVSSALEYISKQGYRAVLASVTRSISELASNIGFAVWVEPEAMITGWKNRSVLMSENAPTIMFNLKSKQTNRIYPSESLSGRLIDPNIINQVSGIKSGKAKSAVANKLNQIHNLTTKKYMNVVELTADALISTPDKMVMRPIWFGSFINEFKKITGVDPDMDKIAQNDENYMSAYSEALEAARNVADESSVRAASSNNAFMTSVKGKNIKGTGITLAAKIAYNNFNNFMTTFLMYEYITARTGVMAAVGNGVVSKKKGAAMLAGVTTRMMVYGMLGTTLANVLASAITGSDDDEEQDKKSFMQSLGQQFASAFTSLMFGRDFGQAARSIINYGVEEVNEDYMDFLREGEYDPYKDAIQYTIFPRGKKKADLGQVMMKMGGSYGPALTTANLIVESLGEEEKKKKDAKQRQTDEMYIRIPLQAAGAAGLVPLYKDVDRIVKKEIYKSIEEAEKISQKRKKAEEASLGGYRNKEEMKEKDPEMYQMKYGPNSVNYQLEKVKKDLEKRKKRIKDRL